VSQSSPSPILAGLKIVEISAFVAAPLAGVTLAALGADVIRVDPPGGGIDIGRWPLHRGRSLYWAGLNQGKRSVTIDTGTDEGRRQVTALVRNHGGILVTNLPVQEWSSYERLSKARPDLIMVVITGNRDGSPAVDYTVNAAVGFPWITGPEGHKGPVNHVLPAWDAMTGFLAGTAILAAERHRRLTGEGQLVELSLADVGMAVAAHLGLVAEAVLVPAPRGRYGNDVYGTFGRDFETADSRHVMVLALTARQWRALAEATGLGERFAELERRLRLDFRQEGDRWRGRHEIFDLLAIWIRGSDLAEVSEIFQRHGVLWGPYQTFQQMAAEDPRVSGPGSLLEPVEHPGLGKFPTTGSPIRFSAAKAVPPQAAPELGQDTEQVLREIGTSAS
jgi:2-methylfumaryl-CoA isomerase